MYWYMVYRYRKLTGKENITMSDLEHEVMPYMVARLNKVKKLDRLDRLYQGIVNMVLREVMLRSKKKRTKTTPSKKCQRKKKANKGAKLRGRS
jgi:hypothetical protein